MKAQTVARTTTPACTLMLASWGAHADLSPERSMTFRVIEVLALDGSGPIPQRLAANSHTEPPLRDTHARSRSVVRHLFAQEVINSLVAQMNNTQQSGTALCRLEPRGTCCREFLYYIFVLIM